MSEPTIIRDNELGGIGMIPLFHDWNIRRCHQHGCKREPTTIIAQDGVHYGLCEDHYQEGCKPGGTTFSLCFDGSDGVPLDYWAAQDPVTR